MTLKEINDYARQLLRDVNRTIFQEIEINRSINEAVDRVRQIKQLKKMTHLTSPNQEPDYLPDEYHGLLSLFCASRCFFQDEQFTQSATLMNEFETKFLELRTAIENGEVDIYDPNGDKVDINGDLILDYVQDIYFTKRTLDSDMIM